MDTEGARALAERIASGPPQDEREKAPLRTEPPLPRPEPAAPRRSPSGGRSKTTVEIFYVKPKPTPTPRRDVRIYVRGANGELERRS